MPLVAAIKSCPNSRSCLFILSNLMILNDWRIIFPSVVSCMVDRVSKSFLLMSSSRDLRTTRAYGGRGPQDAIRNSCSRSLGFSRKYISKQLASTAEAWAFLWRIILSDSKCERDLRTFEKKDAFSPMVLREWRVNASVNWSLTLRTQRTPRISDTKSLMFFMFLLTTMSIHMLGLELSPLGCRWTVEIGKSSKVCSGQVFCNLRNPLAVMKAKSMDSLKTSPRSTNGPSNRDSYRKVVWHLSFDSKYDMRASKNSTDTEGVKKVATFNSVFLSAAMMAVVLAMMAADFRYKNQMRMLLKETLTVKTLESNGK